ncbi:MAG: alanine racemase [Thermoanaerobaculia bacterium]|nr:alanine racemase [Thermoanaerobaculia bacterium]
MSTAPDPEIHWRPTVVEVDVAAFMRNVDTVRGMLPPGSRLIAVLKADGYGHGAVQLARACSRHHVAMIAVSLLEEAMKLHEAAVDIPILVLGPLTAHQIELAAEYEMVLGITGPEMLDAVAAVATRRRRPVRVHLKLDSGMGRMGLVESDLAEAATILTHAPFVQLDALYSHFSTASEPHSAHTSLQIERFRQMAERLRDLGVHAPLDHMANSAATLRAIVNPGDFVRVGMLLFGGEPIDGTRSGLEPVMRWTTRIARLKTMPPGSPIGYGATWTTPRDSCIATIPVGYADGYPYLLSNNADVLIRGRRAPIVGRVSMDLVTVDVTDIDGVALGDEVVLLGRQGDEIVTAEELAGRSGTISYEILCGVGHRVPRTYIGG